MRLVLIALALLPVLATAETAWVTDSLLLGLHQAADTSDRAFRNLESGQEVEVLSRDRNYAFVELPDGVRGYVKAAYLVDEKPAKLVVNEAKAETERLKSELSELKRAFAEPAAMMEQLEQKSDELEAQVDAETQRAEELEAQNASLRSRQRQFRGSLPLTWVGGATLLCLIGGFMAGLQWVDYRSRKRHGGIRIY